MLYQTYIQMRSEMVEQGGPCTVSRRENAGPAGEYTDDRD
jgi:hypothetical protein